MKSLVLSAAVAIIVSTGGMPIQAAPTNTTLDGGTVQTVTVKSHGFRFFHANKKLAMQGVASDSQNDNAKAAKAPAAGSLDYNTDSFIIN